MAKILITGGSGMLGSYVAVQAAESGWETWATYTQHKIEISECETIQLDIRDGSAVQKAFEEVRPDAVIHTAAMAKPDICEVEKGDTYAVNVIGTQNIISACEKVGTRLVHVSTDMVFNGERNPYKTDAPLSPMNYYGLTKVGAETAVYASKIDWAIVRTAIIYGPRKFPWLESFSDKIIETLQAGKTLGAFVDQYRPPIPAWNLAEVLLEIADRKLTGIFHAVCPEPSTRFQFARKVAEVYGLDPELVTPIYMDEAQPQAFRQKILILDAISTSRALNSRLLGFEEGIKGLINRR